MHWARLLFSLSFIAAAASAFIPQNATNRDDRKKALLQKYHLDRARKKEAVEDALNFVLGQEEQANEQRNGTISQPGDVKVVPSRLRAQMPLCQVSMDRIRAEVTFDYDAGAKAPYDYQCWAMRPRYHVAETCAKSEQEKGETNLWQWKWTFESAKKGKCGVLGFLACDNCLR